MNLNPLVTAGLVMIGLAQVWQAWSELQPTPQETHFRVVQGFCKEKAKDTIGPTAAYVACMSGLNR